MKIRKRTSTKSVEGAREGPWIDFVWNAAYKGVFLGRGRWDLVWTTRAYKARGW